jgi:hypothetical protein
MVAGVTSMLVFFQRHLLAGIGLFLGPCIYIMGLLLNVLSIKEMGAPVEIWQIVGGVVFFLAVIGILVKWDQTYAIGKPEPHGGVELSLPNGRHWESILPEAPGRILEKAERANSEARLFLVLHPGLF